MRRAWYFLKWCVGYHHRLYSETIPEASLTTIGLETVAQKITGGRYTWGKVREHHCQVCGKSFWTLSEVDYCKRLRCYLEYHLYTTARVC